MVSCKKCNIDILSELQREKYNLEIKIRKERQIKRDKLIQKRNDKYLFIGFIAFVAILFLLFIGNVIYNYIEYWKKHRKL